MVNVLPTPGSNDGTWGTDLNTWLLSDHNPDGMNKNIVRVFNLKDYGAIGDGVADDSSVIDTVLASAPAGSIVYAPNGTYLTDNFQIPAGVSLVGPKQAIFKMKAAANTTLITLLDGAMLDGITVDGNRANQTSAGNGISISGVNAIVKNCIVYACRGYGITSANKNGVQIENNTISDTRLQSIFVEANNVAIQQVRIVGNTINRSAEGITIAGTGLTLKGTATYKATRCVIERNSVEMPTGAVPQGAICIETFGGVERCRIIGNDCSGGSMGISLDTTIRSTCSENTVYNAKSNGIELASSVNCTVSANAIDGNALTTNGIALSNTTPTHNTISGNNIRGCVTRGILAAAANYSTFTGNMIDMPSNYAMELITTKYTTISGNTLYGNGTATKGICLNASDRCSITGNSLYNFTENGILIYVHSALTVDCITVMGNILQSTNAAVATDLASGGAIGPQVTLIGNPGYSGTYRWDVLDRLNGINVVTGAGTPEGAVGGGPGSVFYRRDGGAGTVLYRKETGVGNTGWVDDNTRSSKLPVSSKTQIADPVNGNDANDGYSFDRAKATIQAAYDALPATGGTVICLPGTYNVDTYPSGRLLLSATKPAIITSLSGLRARFDNQSGTVYDAPVIVGTSAVLCLIAVGTEIGHGMFFSGLHFDMRNTAVLTGILCRDMNYLRVKDCGFEGGGQAGFAIRSQEITNGWADSMGYRIEDNYCRMISLFRGLDDTAILGVTPYYPPNGNLNHIQITNNVIFGNSGWAIDVANMQRSVIQGNMIEGGTSGVRLTGASYKNAIFWQGGEGSPTPYLQFVALAGQAGAYGNFYQNFAADGGVAVDDQAGNSDYASGSYSVAYKGNKGYTAYTVNTILPQGKYNGNVVAMNAATALTLTINRHVNYPIPIGSFLTVVQLGAGAVTVAPEGGGTVIIGGRSGAKLTTTFPGDTIELLKRDINTWVAF